MNVRHARVRRLYPLSVAYFVLDPRFSGLAGAVKPTPAQRNEGQEHSSNYMEKEHRDNYNIQGKGPEQSVAPVPLLGPEGSKALAPLEPPVSELGAYLRQRTVEAQLGLLLQKTPHKEIRTRLLNPGRAEGPGNPRLRYLEHAYVTETLNLLFGFNWDLEVLEQQRVENEAVVKARLRVRLADGSTIVKDSFGGAHYQPGNSNASWADTLKAAQSDALKAAAARLGIGLDLYRHEEQKKEAPVAGNGEQKRDEGTGRSWNWFWGVKVRELGLPREEVHKILGVASVKDWLAQGRTLEEAVQLLEGWHK